MDLKIPYKLTFTLPLLPILTKEPEMLQPDAFCEHTLQQNATAAGALRPLSGFKGAASRRGGGGRKVGREKEGREREREKRGREGGEGEGKDAQLEQGRPLAKAGPAFDMFFSRHV